jgi:hypothetical protein
MTQQRRYEIAAGLLRCDVAKVKREIAKLDKDKRAALSSQVTWVQDYEAHEKIE